MVNVSVAGERWRLPLAGLAMGLALLASACDGSPQAPASPTETTNTDAENAAAAQTQAQRECMITALNDTIYKQQDDSALEVALFAQDLGSCPGDFIQSYVALRNAAKDYLAVGRELSAHQGLKKSADENDWWNLGCSLIAGRQRDAWPSDQWESANSDIKARFQAAQTALETAKRANESIIAGYGIYARTSNEQPQGNNDWTVSNTVDNSSWDGSL